MNGCCVPGRRAKHMLTDPDDLANVRDATDQGLRFHVPTLRSSSSGEPLWGSRVRGCASWRSDSRACRAHRKRPDSDGRYMHIC